ncbi:MAG: serine/threonine-protein kinase [Phycisphaerales bacterium]
METGAANDPQGSRDARGAPRDADLPPTVSAPAPTSPLAKPAEEIAGVHLGPYEVKALLGEGGFGAVYLGEQRDPVRRLAAIKVIRPGREGQHFAERFGAERRILASMDHPNIARILDAGETTDGKQWIAMEYAPGLPISRYCDQNRLTVRDRVALMRTVADAVGFAHEKGVVHRDLKPGNVLVSVDGGRHVPKVIDFGIAKVLGGDATAGETGQVLGTPGFMAPEQTVSAGYDADPRADVYSLGAMLYLLLAGAMPFDHADPAAGALRVRDEDAPPMAARFHALPATEQAEIARNRRSDPRALGHELAGELETIVAKCLDRDRMRRYANAGALVAELDRWEQSRPLEAMPDTVGYRMRKFVQRHFSSVVLAVLLFLSVAVGGAVSAVGWYLASERLEEARAAEHRLGLEASEARAAVAFIGSVLESASIDAAPKGAQTTVLDMLRQAEAHADQTLRDRPATDCAVRLALGRVYTTLAMPDDAQRNLIRGLSLAESAYGRPSTQLAAMYAALAEVTRARRNYPAARELLRQSDDILRALPEPPLRELVANRIADADIQIDAGEAAAALGTLETAQRLAQECTPADTDALGSIEWYRSMAYLALGRYADALAAADRNLAANKARLPDNHWWIAETQTARAAALAGLGRTEEAETTLHLALPQLEHALSPDARALRKALARAAFVEEKAGHPQEAAALRARAEAKPGAKARPAVPPPPAGTPGAQAPPG